MSIQSALSRFTSPVVRRATARSRQSALHDLASQGLPAIFNGPARFLVTGDANFDVLDVQRRVEAQRQRIAAGGSALVEVLYSPKPGSAGVEITPDLRPQHGKIMSFTMERVANTGKNERWGTFLHLLAREVSGTFLELGSCAGISGAYLASAPTCQRLITIEGSAALAQLARETTSAVAPGRVEVVTGLFDDALDDLIPELGAESIDLGFIDGHHERVATLHYFERIKPILRSRAVVIFDDISWSADMRAMWEDVIQQRGIEHAADFGAVGVVILNPASTTARHWDLQPLTGRVPIGQPWGWKE